MVSIGSLTDPLNAPPRGRGGRLHAADTARGVGILAVVFGHAWRGAWDAGLLPDAGIYKTVDLAIYAWHMPLFFLLSGLMLIDVLARTPAQDFVWGRLQRLIWPMALWTWVFFGMKMLAGGAVNHPVTLAEFPLIPLPPYEHLWFLWALFLLQMAALGLWFLSRDAVSDTVLRWGCGIGAVLAALAVPLMGVQSAFFGAAIAHMPYLLAGVALGVVAYHRPAVWMAGLAAVLFGGLIALGPMGASEALRSLLLIVTLSVVLRWLDAGDDQPGVVLTVLRCLGQASMAIFLAHTIFSAAFRIALMSVGVTAPALHLAVAMAVGIFGPLLLLEAARRFGLRKFAGF